MTQSFGEILKQKDRAGLDEIDISHWIERYLFNLLGSEVRCAKIDGGRVLLVSKTSTIRQELFLVTDKLRAAARAQVDYEIKEIKITRFS